MLTSNSKHAFNDLTYARLKDSASSSATVLNLMKGYLTGFLQGWASGRNLYVTIMDAERNLEICKVTGMAWDKLTVERGQDGTAARAWPVGSLISQRLVAASLGRFDQKGEYRTVSYNPDKLLVPSYPGEKVYQNGSAACQKRWFINTESNGLDRWRLLAGELCDWEYYDDGYIKDAYLDYYGDTADGYVKYANANWNTCRGAVTGDAHDDSEGYSANGVFASYDGANYNICRAFFYFDLSGASAGITSVEFHMTVYKHPSELRYASLQEGSQQDPISNDEYDSFNPNSFGLFEVLVASVVPEKQRINYTLNGNGYTYIEGIISAGGIAKIAMREYTRDYSDSPPAPGSNIGISIHYADSPAQIDQPFLRLRYD